MIVSIMQPYFFPYIGYFQLIAQADLFVCYDDVQYMKGGWINRNQILTGGKPSWISYPVQAASLSLDINQRHYRHGAEDVARLLRQVEGAYRKAPRFAEVFPLIEDIMSYPDANVAAFNANLIARVAAHLGIATRLVLSSEIDKHPGLAAQDRVIDICARLGATHYVNPIGGLQLYQHDQFARCGLRLSFLETALGGEAPFLSIIDTMMKCDVGEIAHLLQQFRLVGNEQPCC